MITITATLHRIDADVMRFYVGPCQLIATNVTLEAEDCDAAGLIMSAYAGRTARKVGRAILLPHSFGWRGIVPIEGLVWDVSARRENDDLAVKLSVPDAPVASNDV